MAWGTFPFSQERTWAPPNGGLPPSLAQPPHPAGYVLTKDENGQLTLDGPQVGFRVCHILHIPPRRLCRRQEPNKPAHRPIRQLLANFHKWHRPLVVHLPPAPVGPSCPNPNPPPPLPYPGPYAPSPTQNPTAAPTAGAAPSASASPSIVPEMAPRPQVYAVPGMGIFTVIDAQGDLRCYSPWASLGREPGHRGFCSW
ncbi:hypothetical protein GX50_02331 [[Emmonsia] crescens]|uniref:Uncharacterized protein n=1 Tax=[Emmonsia] crescens TaxID=73230 RepID=A0A2B7ZP34_9EURO|nr:hypothetical protein GX50_02331 [Emmonsia crescens]